MMFVKMEGDDIIVECERCYTHWHLRLPVSVDAMVPFLDVALHHQCKPLDNRDVLRSEA